MDSDLDSGPMDSDSHLMDSDSGLMDSDSDSDSDSGLEDSDSLPDSRVRTHSNTGSTSDQRISPRGLAKTQNGKENGDGGISLTDRLY